jgi:anti-anti-sigma factor
MAKIILEIIETESGITMAYEGEFNVTNVEHIKEALLQSAARKGNETLLLTAVTAMDVSGIQLAYSWKKILQAQGRKADVVLPQLESIKDLLEKTGLTQMF